MRRKRWTRSVCRKDAETRKHVTDTANYLRRHTGKCLCLHIESVQTKLYRTICPRGSYVGRETNRNKPVCPKFPQLLVKHLRIAPPPQCFSFLQNKERGLGSCGSTQAQEIHFGEQSKLYHSRKQHPFTQR